MATSISLQQGFDGQRYSDFTVGTNAPTAGIDIELRIATVDQSGNPIKRKSVVIALESFIRALIDEGKNSILGSGYPV